MLMSKAVIGFLENDSSFYGSSLCQTEERSINSQYLRVWRTDICCLLPLQMEETVVGTAVKSAAERPFCSHLLSEMHCQPQLYCMV